MKERGGKRKQKKNQSVFRRRRNYGNGSFRAWQNSLGGVGKKATCKVLALFLVFGSVIFIFGLVTYVTWKDIWLLYGPILMGVGGFIDLLCLIVFLIVRNQWSKQSKVVANTVTVSVSPVSFTKASDMEPGVTFEAFQTKLNNHNMSSTQIQNQPLHNNSAASRTQSNHAVNEHACTVESRPVEDVRQISTTHEQSANLHTISTVS